MNDPQSIAVLRSLNIDIVFLCQLLSILFPESDSTVPMIGIMELMLMCRGDLPITVLHMASGQAFLHDKIVKLEQSMLHHLKEGMVELANLTVNGSGPLPTMLQHSTSSLVLRSVQTLARDV